MPKAHQPALPRICIVHTGGTMGSKPSANGLLEPASLAEFESQVNELARERSWPAAVSFRPVAGELIDSANATPLDWLRVRDVLQLEWSKFDGFVVVHGTDTMPYVAAFLSFAIEFQDKPVVVTGSMKPIFEEGDGASNLEASVRVAVTPTAEGTPIDQVLICFGGAILRGNRATKLSLESAGIDTPRVGVLGRYPTDGTTASPDWGGGKPKRQVRLNDPVRFRQVRHHRLGLLRLFPGISPAMVSHMLVDLDGLVVEAYGSGTGPEDLRAILEAFAEHGKFVVVTTEVLNGSVQPGYEADLVRKGSSLIPGGTMLAEAALAKLYYFLGIATNGPKRRSFVMEQMMKSSRGDR